MNDGNSSALMRTTTILMFIFCRRRPIAPPMNETKQEREGEWAGNVLTDEIKVAGLENVFQSH